MTTVHSVTTAFIIINSICWNLTVNHPVYIAIMMITISRSQSRITSSTLSIWKNTYSNFNMVTLHLINMKTIISKTIPPGKTIELVLLRRSFLDYQQHNCMSCRITSSPSKDDQQLRHRHRHDLRYGYYSPCPPSTDHSTKTTSFILDRNCETKTLKDT